MRKWIITAGVLATQAISLSALAMSDMESPFSRDNSPGTQAFVESVIRKHEEAAKLKAAEEAKSAPFRNIEYAPTQSDFWFWMKSKTLEVHVNGKYYGEYEFNNANDALLAMNSMMRSIDTSVKETGRAYIFKDRNGYMWIVDHYPQEQK